MKKHGRVLLLEGLGAILGFILWTVLVKSIDVQAIGPQESEVGFATLNKHLHDLIGTNRTLYVITDWLGLVPIVVALGFALFGIFQLWKRKSIFKVDKSILALGVFYITVAAVYIFFEMVVINYRPILIDGILEASYPSSTTMLVLCVMPTAAMQFYNRIKNNTLKLCVIIAIALFITFTVVGRILSGVHWITDITGGMLFSFGAVMIYGYFLRNS